MPALCCAPGHKHSSLARRMLVSKRLASFALVSGAVIAISEGADINRTAWSVFFLVAGFPDEQQQRRPAAVLGRSFFEVVVLFLGVVCFFAAHVDRDGKRALSEACASVALFLGLWQRPFLMWMFAAACYWTDIVFDVAMKRDVDISAVVRSFFSQ